MDWRGSDCFFAFAVSLQAAGGVATESCKLNFSSVGFIILWFIYIQTVYHISTTNSPSVPVRVLSIANLAVWVQSRFGDPTSILIMIRACDQVMQSDYDFDHRLVPSKRRWDAVSIIATWTYKLVWMLCNPSKQYEALLVHTIPRNELQRIGERCERERSAPHRLDYSFNWCISTSKVHNAVRWPK